MALSDHRSDRHGIAKVELVDVDRRHRPAVGPGLALELGAELAVPAGDEDLFHT